jgi:hypothetical protein
MALRPRLSGARTTGALGAPVRVLMVLREAWSLNSGPGQPSLRDYPLRRAAGDLR